MRSIAPVALLVTASAFLVGDPERSAAEGAAIHACVIEQNGRLRIVADPAQCIGREVPLSWSQQGPPGVFDGDGRLLGAIVRDVSAPQLFGGLLDVLLEDAGVVVQLNIGTGNLVNQRIWYGSENCQGDAFLDLPNSNRVVPDFVGGLLLGSTTEFVEEAVIGSERLIGIGEGGCSNHRGPSTQGPLVRAHRFDGDLEITLPVKLPIWVGQSPP